MTRTNQLPQSAAEAMGATIQRQLEVRDMDDLTEAECCGGGREGGAAVPAAPTNGGKPKGPGGGKRRMVGVPVLPTG